MAEALEGLQAVIAYRMREGVDAHEIVGIAVIVSGGIIAALMEPGGRRRIARCEINMATIGVLVPASPGHLNPMGALGRELAGRGHRVTVAAFAEAEPAARAAGLE